MVTVQGVEQKHVQSQRVGQGQGRERWDKTQGAEQGLKKILNLDLLLTIYLEQGSLVQ